MSPKHVADIVRSPGNMRMLRCLGRNRAAMVSRTVKVDLGDMGKQEQSVFPCNDKSRRGSSRNTCTSRLGEPNREFPGPGTRMQGRWMHVLRNHPLAARPFGRAATRNGLSDHRRGHSVKEGFVPVARAPAGQITDAGGSGDAHRDSRNGIHGTRDGRASGARWPCRLCP